MAKSYFEEFEKKYNRPRMNDVTVGFSGIDPAPKSEFDTETARAVASQAFEDRTASSEEVSAMLDEIWG